MKRFLILITASLLTCTFAATGLFAETSADTIMKAVLGRKTPGDSTATSTMTITDRTGVTKVRKLKTVSKETGEGTRTYIEFVEPADVNGTKFLTVSKQGAETDQRLYLPALKKVRKISSSSKDAEFLGSDLCYFDMEKRYFEDGTYTLLSGSETLSEPAFTGMTFARISTAFKASNAPYSKTIMWINLADNLVYKTECYDKKDDALLKTITVDEVKTIKGYAMMTRTTIVNHKKGSTTVVTLADIIVDTGIKDSAVSLKRLEQ